MQLEQDLLHSTDSGLHRIRQAVSTGARSDLMDSVWWGWGCMLQLQEAEYWKKPATTTWAAEFLLREGESREILGLWSAVHEAKKIRAKQVITCSFPCGKWLHMIGVRASSGFELCRRARKTDSETMADVIPTEAVAQVARVAHIQSAGCKTHRKSVIGAHNQCWKYLIGAIMIHGESRPCRRQRSTAKTSVG